MSSKLVNVRLDADRVRKARRLRSKGVSLSDVVREAIDARYADTATATRRDVRALAQRIFEQHPDPRGSRRRGYDVHDAKAARTAIRARLARDRRG